MPASSPPKPENWGCISSGLKSTSGSGSGLGFSFTFSGS